MLSYQSLSKAESQIFAPPFFNADADIFAGTAPSRAETIQPCLLYWAIK